MGLAELILKSSCRTSFTGGFAVIVLKPTFWTLVASSDFEGSYLIRSYGTYVTIVRANIRLYLPNRTLCATFFSRFALRVSFGTILAISVSKGSYLMCSFWTRVASVRTSKRLEPSFWTRGTSVVWNNTKNFEGVYPCITGACGQVIGSFNLQTLLPIGI
jgi:hypothetical protein